MRASLDSSEQASKTSARGVAGVLGTFVVLGLPSASGPLAKQSPRSLLLYFSYKLNLISWRPGPQVTRLGFSGRQSQRATSILSLQPLSFFDGPTAHRMYGGSFYDLSNPRAPGPEETAASAVRFVESVQWPLSSCGTASGSAFVALDICKHRID